jgi:hypothetical protein
MSFLRRYCIIGAGPAGLMAARSFQAAGLDFDVYEKYKDLGGIWQIKNPESPVYQSAHFISSKTISKIPGFPMPRTFPDYPSHGDILFYLKEFAKEYGLRDKISFNSTVETVIREESGNWLVKLEKGGSQSYDGLVICNGHTWDPNWPKYKGSFKGEKLHSLHYKSPDILKGKRVLVVGGGNSAIDIACDAAIHAKSAAISLRRGYHFFPKHVLGLPSDVINSILPMPAWFQKIVAKIILRVFVGDITRLGLPTPDHGPLESHPIVNSQVLHYLSHGDLCVKKDIESFDGKTVFFQDGVQEDFDLILFATGYNVRFPFLADEHFSWKERYPELFLNFLHPKYDNLAVIGLTQTDGGAYEFFTKQADILANIFRDQQNYPERIKSLLLLKEKGNPNLQGGRRYISSDRHETYVRMMTMRKYLDRLFRKMDWTKFHKESHF